MKLPERVLFVWGALKSPRHLGSITPSSHFLVNTLLSLGHVRSASHILELGPGTGPFTVGLLQAMAPDARLLCIERDAAFAEHLRQRCNDPRLTVAVGDAEHMAAIADDHGFPRQWPLIVSGLPFTSLPPTVRDAILDTVKQSLLPGRPFLLYQYSRAMLPHFRRYFTSVTIRREFRNLPPAYAFAFRNPVEQGRE